MSNFDPNEAITYIIKNSEAHAKAKANRVYLEAFRKTRKAQLMNKCDQKTVAEKEAYAYAHSDYQDVIEGLREAVEQEEKLKFLLIAAQLRVEVYRTESANNRRQDNATR